MKPVIVKVADQVERKLRRLPARKRNRLNRAIGNLIRACLEV